MRSYEDQWTEEEFEKLCQVEPLDSESPKMEDASSDLCSIKESPETKTDASEPPVSQSLKDAVRLLKQSQLLADKLPIEALSTLKEPLLQFNSVHGSSKDNPKPAKRGRGRPKRVTSDTTSIPPVTSTSSRILRMQEMGSQNEELALPSVKEDTVKLQQDPVGETTSGSITTSAVTTPLTGKGRARKTKGGELTRNRAKKHCLGLSATAHEGFIGSSSTRCNKSQAKSDVFGPEMNTANTDQLALKSKKLEETVDVCLVQSGNMLGPSEQVGKTQLNSSETHSEKSQISQKIVPVSISEHPKDNDNTPILVKRKREKKTSKKTVARGTKRNLQMIESDHGAFKNIITKNLNEKDEKNKNVNHGDIVPGSILHSEDEKSKTSSSSCLPTEKLADKFELCRQVAVQENLQNTSGNVTGLIDDMCDFQKVKGIEHLPDIAKDVNLPPHDIDRGNSKHLINKASDQLSIISTSLSESVQVMGVENIDSLAFPITSEQKSPALMNEVYSNQSLIVTAVSEVQTSVRDVSNTDSLKKVLKTSSLSEPNTMLNRDSVVHAKTCKTSFPKGKNLTSLYSSVVLAITGSADGNLKQSNKDNTLNTEYLDVKEPPQVSPIRNENSMEVLGAPSVCGSAPPVISSVSGSIEGSVQDKVTEVESHLISGDFEVAVGSPCCKVELPSVDISIKECSATSDSVLFNIPEESILSYEKGNAVPNVSPDTPNTVSIVAQVTDLSPTVETSSAQQLKNIHEFKSDQVNQIKKNIVNDSFNSCSQSVDAYQAKAIIVEEERKGTYHS